jgi:D-alanyl-D-alanine carboxypeptidase (penicillin-binding protein 5/6)
MEEDNNATNSEITAKAALLINDTTQEVIYANSAYDRIYPASTTKLLTALVAMKYAKATDLVTISEDNAGITTFGAKLCNFKKGDTLTMETLLNCLLVYSGNDAAIAIAEHIAGSEEAFVKKMNEEAALLGATGTHFTNPHGLHDPNHYTTAYDMYLIFKACLEYEEFLPIIQQTSYDAKITGIDGIVKTVPFESTNMFLLGTMATPEGVTVFGGKTGSTSDAGDCLILYSKSESGDGYISAIFKADGKTSLYEQQAALLKME